MPKHTFLGLVVWLTCARCAIAGEAPELDLYGDPLPAGAVARLGSDRWRYEGQISAMTFSSDGKYLACAGVSTPADDHAPIKILDARSGKQLRRLLGHGVNVLSLAFSPSGSLLASCGADDRIRLWDAAAGVALWSYHWPDGQILLKPSSAGLLAEPTTSTLMTNGSREAFICHLQFSPDGKHLLLKGLALPNQSPYLDHLVGILEVASGEQVRKVPTERLGKLRRFNAFLSHLLADGATLAVVAPGDILQLRDVMTGELRSQVKFTVPDMSVTTQNRQGVHDVRCFWVSPDKKTLLLGTGERLASIDIASGKVITTLAQREGRSDPVDPEVVFSPAGKTMALLLHRGGDCELRIADARTGQMVSNLSFTVLNRLRPHAVFSADGKRLAVDVSRTIRLWDVESGDEIPTDVGHSDTVDAVALSPDGAMAATASWDHSVRLWQTHSGRELRRWSLAWMDPCEFRLAFSPDSKLLALAKRGQIDLVTCSDGKTARTLKGYLADNQTIRDAWACAIAFSGDGTQLVSLRSAPWPRHERVFQRWDVRSGKILAEKHLGIGDQQGPEFTPQGVELFQTSAISPSLKRLITLHFASQAMYFWETETEKPLCRLNSAKGFTTARFSPDDKLVAVGVQSGPLYLLDSQKGTTVRKIAGPPGLSLPRAFLDDGRVLLSDHHDNSTRFWDVGSDEELYRFEGHRIRACSPDGRYAASVSEDHVLLIWDLVALRKRLEAARFRQGEPSPAVVGGHFPDVLAGQRKWTDSTGKYTVFAQLIELQKDAVRLRKESGSVVTVPFARLSRADRELLQLAATQPPAAAEQGPGASPSEPPEIELATDTLPAKKESPPPLPLPKDAFLLLTFDRGTFLQEASEILVFDLAHEMNAFGGVGVGFSPEGRAGGALDLQGGLLLIPKPPLNKRSQYTLTMWVKSNSPGDLYRELSKTEKAGYALGIEEDRCLYVGARNSQKPGDTWMVVRTPANSVPRGKWFFLAVRAKDAKAGNGKLNVTIDDQSFDFNLQSPDVDNPRCAELRGAPPGMMDEVTIFHRALSDEEIKTLRQMGLNGQPLMKKQLAVLPE